MVKPLDRSPFLRALPAMFPTTQCLTGACAPGSVVSGQDPAISASGSIFGRGRTSKKSVNLDISRNKIGDDGAREIAEGLRNNTHLRKLMLGDNGIGPHGAEAIAQAIGDGWRRENFDQISKFCANLDWPDFYFLRSRSVSKFYKIGAAISIRC